MLPKPLAGCSADECCAVQPAPAREPVWTKTKYANLVRCMPKALEGVDQVLVIGEGRVQSFGPKEEVLGKVLRPATPLKVVADNEGGGRWTAT